MKKCLLSAQSSKAVLQLFSIFFISGCAFNFKESQNLKNISYHQKHNSAYMNIDSIREYRQYLYEYDSDTGTYRTLLISNHGIHGLLVEYPGGISFDDSLAKIGTKYVGICEELIEKGFANDSPKILFENYDNKLYVKKNIKRYTRRYDVKEENRKIIVNVQAGLINSAEVAARLNQNKKENAWLGYGGGADYWSTGCEINKSGDSTKVWPFQVNAPE